MFAVNDQNSFSKTALKNLQLKKSVCLRGLLFDHKRGC